MNNFIEDPAITLEEYLKKYVPRIDVNKVREHLDDIRIFDFSWGPLPKEFPLVRRTIFLAEGMPTHQILEFMQRHRVRHVVQKNRTDFVLDIFAAAMMIRNPKGFCTRPLPFFIPGQNKLDEINFRYEFSSTYQKRGILEDLESHLKESHPLWRHRDKLLLISDEFLTNAIFHGPRDAGGKPLYAGLNRNQDVSIHVPNGAPVFYFTANGDRAFIGVSDVFGTLDQKYLIEHLIRIYDPAKKTPIKPVGPGSGLGIKLAIDNSIGFYCVVRANLETFVCVSLPVNGSQVDFTRTPKNIHFVAD